MTFYNFLQEICHLAFFGLSLLQINHIWVPQIQWLICKKVVGWVNTCSHLALMSDCVISEWELYSVIFQCLCQLGLLQMILYLHFWQFFGPCWRNFLCLDTWRMVIYPLQLAELFHKQFNLQVWQKISNCGFAWQVMGSSLHRIKIKYLTVFDVQASTLWQYCPEYFIASQQIFCHSKIMNATSEQVGCLYDDLQVVKFSVMVSSVL